MKFQKLSITFLFLCSIVLSGCVQAINTPTAATTQTQIATIDQPLAATATSIQLSDGLGNEVRLAAPARRIVSLGPSNTEILFAVGAGSQVVGCDRSSDYPAEAKPLATIVDYPALNVESIVALQPDLVLAAEIISTEQVQAMQDLGLTVYRLSNPTELPEGLYKNIQTVGWLTGNTGNAEALVEKMRMRVDAVRQTLSRAAGSPLVYYEIDATDPVRPFTAGPGNFIDSLMRLAGGRNLGAVLDSPWAQISSEEILRQNPDIILLGDSLYGITPESVASRPGWQNLRAVKNGAVYPFDDNLVSRPGPRMVDGLVALIRLIHPELF